MGIFGQMADKFSKQNTDLEQDVVETAQEEDGGVDLDIDPHIPVSILNSDNDEQVALRLIVIGLEEITLERLPGVMQLPLYKHGETVRFIAYDDNIKATTYKGKIKQSSYIKLVIGDIEEEKHAEHREHSRQMISIEATIETEDEPTPTKCLIKDISLGGARLTTTKMYPRDWEFRLRVKLADNQEQLTLRGKFMRMAKRSDGSLEYGTMFAQLDEVQSHAIANGIIEAQKELKAKVGLE